MNTIKKVLLAVVIALSSFAAFTTTEAAPVSFTNGDIFLGFENSAGTQNYLYDLGNGANFAASVFNGTFSAVNLNADLTTVFGADWSTNTSTGLLYGIFGLPSNKSIVYASVGTGNAAPDMIGVGGLSTASSHFVTMASAYNFDRTAQGLTLGVYQTPGAGSDTQFKSWSGNSPSTQPFATYNASFENGVAGKLDFYGTTGSTSTLEGSLQLTSGGLFELVAVPEPSTYALFVLGAIVLLAGARRRMNHKTA